MPKEQVEVTYTGPDEIVSISVVDGRRVEVVYSSSRVVRYFYSRVVSEVGEPVRPIHMYLGKE